MKLILNKGYLWIRLPMPRFRLRKGWRPFENLALSSKPKPLGFGSLLGNSDFWQRSACNSKLGPDESGLPYRELERNRYIERNFAG